MGQITRMEPVGMILPLTILAALIMVYVISEKNGINILLANSGIFA